MRGLKVEAPVGPAGIPPREELAGFYCGVALLPLGKRSRWSDDGRMVPVQMMKELADERSAALRELWSPRPATTAGRTDAVRRRLLRVLSRIHLARPRPDAAPMPLPEAPCPV